MSLRSQPIPHEKLRLSSPALLHCRRNGDARQCRTADARRARLDRGFAGFESRSLRFQFLPDGTAIVHPLFKDKQSYPYVRIPLTISLEESLADGSTSSIPCCPESLESADKPTLKLKDSTVKGRFEGGGSFELTLAQKSATVVLGGKLLDPGTFSGSGVRLRISAEILNFYGREEKRLGNDPQAFGELVAKSSLSYTTKDRKRTKLDFSQSLDSGILREGRETHRVAQRPRRRRGRVVSALEDGHEVVEVGAAAASLA